MVSIEGKNLTIAGGILSIVSVFLPWYSASVSGSATGSQSVNGLSWVSGELPFKFFSENVNWEVQGIGVLALGIASVAVALLLRDKLQGAAMVACGFLIIGGGVVNLWNIGSMSGEIFPGMTMQSGVGYGLYAVVLGGMVAAAGGLLAWRDSPTK